MPKFLDMPIGNGVCPAYEEFASQVQRGRSVAIVRVLDENGFHACFINSGEPVGLLTEHNTFLHSLALTAQCRRRAEQVGHHPTSGHTNELA